MTLQLECKIRRKDGTDVSLPPDTIQFRPLDPTRPDSPHVATVTNAQAMRLIGVAPETYVLFEAPAAPALKPTFVVDAEAQAAKLQQAADAARATLAALEAEQKPASLQAPPAPVLTPAQEAAIDAATDALTGADEPPASPALAPVAPAPTATQTADTNDDGALSVRELKNGIAKGTFSAEQLRELMAQEEERAEPRSSFIAEIVKALK